MKITISEAAEKRLKEIYENHVSKNERKRKKYAARGTRSQVRMSFRLDNELEEWINRQPNKGRYINELIRKDMERV